MSDRAEIDRLQREYAEALRGRPAATIRAIAVRLALREVPALFEISDRDPGAVLNSLHAILTAAVCAVRSEAGASAELDQVVRSAVATALSDIDATETGTGSNFFAFQAACTAIEVSGTYPDHDLARQASKLESHAVEFRENPGAEIALTAAIREAAATTGVRDTFSAKLGRGAADPARYNLETMRAAARQDPAWAFWVRWWEGFADGRPLPWDLQERIVLDIGRSRWLNLETTAKQIAIIEAEFVAAKLPQAERIIFDDEAVVFRREPIPLAKPGLIGATLSRLEDAWNDVVARPSNGLSETSREARLIVRTLRKYGNDPQRIEMDLTDLHRSLVRQITVTQEVPASEENIALQAAAEEGAQAIRATHPEVAENRKILQSVVWREMPGEQKEQLRAALPVLQAISDEELSAEWAQDIPELLNDAIAPPAANAPPLPGADAAARVFSRVAKMSLVERSMRTTERLYNHPVRKMGAVLAAGRTIGYFFMRLVNLGIQLL